MIRKIGKINKDDFENVSGMYQYLPGEPSALQMMVGMLSRKSDVSYNGLRFPTSVKLEPDNHCMVEAMSRRSKKSRNVIINELIHAAIDDVLDHIHDDHLRHDLINEAEKIMGEFNEKLVKSSEKAE